MTYGTHSEKRQHSRNPAYGKCGKHSQVSVHLSSLAGSSERIPATAVSRCPLTAHHRASRLVCPSGSQNVMCPLSTWIYCYSEYLNQWEELRFCFSNKPPGHGDAVDQEPHHGRPPHTHLLTWASATLLRGRAFVLQKTKWKLRELNISQLGGSRRRIQTQLCLTLKSDLCLFHLITLSELQCDNDVLAELSH